MDEPPIQVSACVLACNHVRYIRRSLEGVVAQAGDVTMEILVGDDCSDDGTSAIVAEFAAAYPGLVTHIRHDPRIGGTANYMDVLRRARGMFIADLDGDDYWMPGKLKRQVDYLMTHPDCVAVYAKAITISERGDPIGRFNDAPDKPFDLAFLLRRGNFLNTSSMMFRGSMQQAILAMEGAVLDFAIHLRLAREGLLAQLEEPLVAYRVSSTSSTLAQQNDFVRALYWESILGVPRDRVTDDDFAQGVADFLRRVTFRSIRTRRLSLLRTWAPRVFEASPYGRIRTSWLVARSILRTVFAMFVGFFRTDEHGQRVKVLYRY